MALIDYTYVDVNSVYGYESYGTFYGVKVLKVIYLDAVQGERFIVQHGSAKSGEDFVTRSDGKDLAILSETELKADYGKLYKKSTFKKGDVLTGEDTKGKTVVLLFESEDRVHRMTRMDGSYQDRSSASLEYYERKLKNIQAVKSTWDGRKFSEIFG